MASYQPTPSERMIYEGLWNAAPVNPDGVIAGSPAVDFLRKSTVEMTILKRIWSLSTPVSTMNKNQFFVALRYIALHQQGLPDLSQDLLLDTMYIAYPPPAFPALSPPPGIPMPVPPGPSPRSQAIQNGFGRTNLNNSDDSSTTSDRTRSSQFSAPSVPQWQSPSSTASTMSTESTRSLARTRTQYTMEAPRSVSTTDSYSPQPRTLNRVRSEYTMSPPTAFGKGVPAVSPAGGNVEVQRVVWIGDGIDTNDPPVEIATTQHPQFGYGRTEADYRNQQLSYEQTRMKSAIIDLEIKKSQDLRMARDVATEVRQLEETLTFLRSEQELAKQRMFTSQSLEDQRRYEELGQRIQITYQELQTRSPMATPSPAPDARPFAPPNSLSITSSVDTLGPYTAGSDSYQYQAFAGTVQSQPSSQSQYPQFAPSPKSQSGKTTSQQSSSSGWTASSRSTESSKFSEQGMMYVSSDSTSAFDKSSLGVSTSLSALSMEQEFQHQERIHAAEKASQVDSIRSELMKLDVDISNSRIQLDAAITLQMNTIKQFIAERQELVRQKLKYDPTQCLISSRMATLQNEKLSMDGVLMVMYEELQSLEKRVEIKRREFKIVDMREYQKYEANRDRSTDNLNIMSRIAQLDCSSRDLSVDTSNLDSFGSQNSPQSAVTPRTRRQQELMKELERLKRELDSATLNSIDRQKSEQSAALQRMIYDVQSQLSRLSEDDSSYTSTTKISASVRRNVGSENEHFFGEDEFAWAGKSFESNKSTRKYQGTEDASLDSSGVDSLEMVRRLALDAERAAAAETDRLNKLKAAQAEARAALEAERIANEEAEIRRQSLAKAENDRRAQEMAAIARAQADRDAALKAAAAAKQEADRIAAETLSEASQARAAEAERKRLIAQRIEAEKRAAEAAAAALIEAEKLEKAKAQRLALAQRAEQERLTLEEEERQRKETAELRMKIEAERVKAMKEAALEQERQAEEAERVRAMRIRKEAEQAAALRAEQARQDAERQAQMEAERRALAAESARLEAERARLEAERIAAAKAEQARLEAEKAAAAKAEQARLEAERIAAAKAEERRVKEAAEAAERARIEAEKLAAQKAYEARIQAERKAAQAAEEAARKAEEERIASVRAQENKRAAIAKATEADSTRRKLLSDFMSRKALVIATAAEAEQNYIEKQAEMLSKENSIAELERTIAALEMELKTASKSKADSLEFNAFQSQLESVQTEVRLTEETLQSLTQVNVAAKSELPLLRAEQEQVSSNPLDQELYVLDQSVAVEYSIIAALRIILLSYSGEGVVEDGPPVQLPPKLADELKVLKFANVDILQQKDNIMEQIARFKATPAAAAARSRLTISSDPNSTISYSQSAFNPRAAVQKDKTTRGMNELERRLAARKATLDSSIAAAETGGDDMSWM